MAVLSSIPSQAVIDGLRGRLDFYERLGTVCARRWPRWKLTRRAPAVVEQQIIFTYATKIHHTLPANVVETWQDLARQSNLTWRDWFIRAYVGGTLTAPGMPPL